MSSFELIFGIKNISLTLGFAMKSVVESYIAKLSQALGFVAMQDVPLLGNALRKAWSDGRSIFICGNGGSAGNAIHLANDFLHGAGKNCGKGLKVEALCANSAVLTCLANDVGYEHIYSEQLKVKGQKGDLLIVLSGSGNSPNIVKALEMGNAMGMETFAILGFTGGRSKQLAKYPIHFDINDMQIAEDLQMVIGHMCMQWLSEQTVVMVD
jgi:D-sedoheptulose 7-phosphate isomerase